METVWIPRIMIESPQAGTPEGDHVLPVVHEPFPTEILSAAERLKDSSAERQKAKILRDTCTCVCVCTYDFDFTKIVYFLHMSCYTGYSSGKLLQNRNFTAFQ